MELHIKCNKCPCIFQRPNGIKPLEIQITYLMFKSYFLDALFFIQAFNVI